MYGKLVDNFSHESDVTSLQDTRWRKLQAQRLRVEKMAKIRHGFGRECLLGFYGEHNSKNRKGSCRDVT